MNFKHMKQQMIPDTATVEELQGKLKKNRKGKNAVKWTGAIAACFVLSLTVLSFTVPSFAENLPLVGGIFASINNRTGKYKEPFVNDIAAQNAVMVNEKAGTEKDPVGLTLSEVYCDGLNVSYSFYCERPESWGEISCGSFDLTAITVNGRDCTDNLLTLPRFVYENGRFEGSGHFNLYRSFDMDEIPDVLNVKMTLTDMTPSDEMMTYDEEHTLALCSTWTFNLSVKANKSDTEYVRVNEEHDGWMLEETANAPSGAIVKIRAPKDVTIENYFEKNDVFLSVCDADGNAVESYGSSLIENDDKTVTYLFEMRGLETSVHGVKMTLLDKIDGEYNEIAEFSVK